MEIRQLRYFLSAMRHGSHRAAAKENFVTQPAVSIQLKKLEEEFGEKLYTRRGRRLEPTQAGNILVAESEEIIRRVDALAHRIRGIKGLESGVLKMGNIDAASTSMRTAKNPRTTGCCSHAPNRAPDNAAKTPSSEYVVAIPRT